MDRNDHVEFLTDSGERLPDEPEVLGGGPDRRPVSRRTVLGGLLAVAIVAAAGTAIRHAGNPKPEARPPFSATKLSPPPAPNRPTATATTPTAADAVPLTAPGPAYDVAALGHRLYVLQASRLSLVDTRSLRTLASVEAGTSDLAGWRHLVVDPNGSRVWLVTQQNGPALIVLYDAVTLRQLRVTTTKDAIQNATAMDNALYFTTSDGVAVSRSGEEHPTLIYRGDVTSALASDPLRHRVLVLVFASGRTSVVALSATGAQLASVSTGLGKADIGVTGLTIWLAGFGDHGAVLQQLDPRTLRGGDNLDPASQLGAGAVIAATGQETVWVRSAGGDSNADVLWCRDAFGEIVSWWTAPGDVAAADGVTFVSDDKVVHALHPIGNCTS